jgi:hypothetical protein
MIHCNCALWFNSLVGKDEAHEEGTWVKDKGGIEDHLREREFVY